ncbi:hypothetical protein FIE12Z_4373 [Fusarium flagelliforme]|uniref:NAD-dependent epimerase/dehydratase domain-containing protein n=1 Tax=Fusarium flagelliforme TaxID=2675880 RepID=A0A395MVS4_9HYPO|nr:hypothetical protein FIE12Z_4373 [Fusarium flagelliforme]
MSDLPTSIPRGSWVLVTGASGYTGSHVVIEFLKQGFNVRGTTRDLTYGNWLLEHPSVKPFADQGKVELVEADTTKPGDFDDAVKGVFAVVHLGNIGELTPDPNVAFQSAEEAALSVCRSAAKEPSIKRFTLAAGLWTSVWCKPGETKTINQQTWNDDLVKLAKSPPPYELSRMLAVYLAARVEAEKAVWKFVKDENLSWEVNTLLQQLYLGKTEALKENTTVYYTHVSDAAVVYVAATIDPDVKGDRIPVLAKSFNWNNALAILRSAYPEEDFEEDFIPGDPVLSYNIENKTGPELLQKWAGRKWIGFEQGITETIDYSRKIGNLD